MQSTISKKYTKKVLPIGDASSAEARAERLKRLRNLANLDRKAMCDESTININTLKGWEIGRYGGLPIDGAEKVIKRVEKENVICSLDWLLHGIGTGPYLLNSSTSNVQAASEFSEIRYKEFLISTSKLFKETFQQSIELEINDDAMFPNYNMGDKVWGVFQSINELPLTKIKEKEYLVQLENGEVLLRRIFPAKQSTTFDLYCNNVKATVNPPVIYNATIQLLSPVLIHIVKIN